jgi:hypothetical protein
MSPFSGRTKSSSPVRDILHWCRGWTRPSASTELKCVGEEEVDRMARDIGMSASELRKVARRGPAAADLLLRRMTVLELDHHSVSRKERRTFQDLQRLCTLCASHRRCARDIASDPADPKWEEYCPNAGTLTALRTTALGARHARDAADDLSPTPVDGENQAH